MKVFIVLALAAVALAEPESDPALLYKTYGTLPYTGYTGYTGYSALGYKPVLPYSAGYTSGYNYGVPSVYGRLFKREAEAEPEADPALVYGSSILPYSAYTPYTGIYNKAIYPTTAYSAYSAYNYGVPSVYGRLFKREAEAEPEADPALVYGSSILPYSAYTPYTGIYNKAVYPTTPYSAYSAYNYGVPSVYGRLFKREAEAESDPELVYTNGQFHTNLRNLHKGVHLNQARPYGSIYDVQSYKPVYTQPISSYIASPYAAPLRYF